eukprot:3017836-Rhodomonas_salina.2
MQRAHESRAVCLWTPPQLMHVHPTSPRISVTVAFCFCQSPPARLALKARAHSVMACAVQRRRHRTEVSQGT